MNYVKAIYKARTSPRASVTKLSSSEDLRQHISCVVPNLTRSYNEERPNVPSVPMTLQSMHLTIETIDNIRLGRLQMERRKVFKINKVWLRDRSAVDLTLEPLDGIERRALNLSFRLSLHGVVPVEVIAWG